MKKTNTIRKPKYTQVCIWPATNLGKGTVDDFQDWCAEQGIRVQFLEIVTTFPDVENDAVVPDTGGRTDLFFAVHDKDINKIAAWRLPYGIRWIEDATSSMNDYDKNPIYPERVLEYRSWEA